MNIVLKIGVDKYFFNKNNNCQKYNWFVLSLYLTFIPPKKEDWFLRIIPDFFKPLKKYYAIACLQNAL